MTPDWSPEARASHEKIMRAVTTEIASGKGVYVLKGGTALMFARGLDRFSTDLDYDSSKKLSLEATVRVGFRKTGARIADLRILRDSGLAQSIYDPIRTEVARTADFVGPDLVSGRTCVGGHTGNSRPDARSGPTRA
jgi:hypothetical protein